MGIKKNKVGFIFGLLLFKLSVSYGGSASICPSLFEGQSASVQSRVGPHYPKGDTPVFTAATEIVVGPNGNATVSLNVPSLPKDKYKNYLGANPPLSEEAESKARTLGLMWWSDKIVFVESLSEAEAHLQLKTQKSDLMYQPYYFVTPLNGVGKDALFNGSRTNEIGILSNISLEQQWQNMFIHPNGDSRLTGIAFKTASGWDYLTKDEAKRFLKNKSKFKTIVEDGVRQFFILQWGWLQPHKRGVVLLDKFFSVENKPKLKRLIKDANRLVRLGYFSKITFNQDFSGVIRLAMSQRRKDKGPEANRISENEYNLFMNLFKEKKAYSIEIWDKDQNLIGGGYGTINKGIVVGDSIAYPGIYKSDGYDIDGIDVAKVFQFYRYLLLYEAGFKFYLIDALTNFSKGVGGEYLTQSEYTSLLPYAVEKNISFKDVGWSEVFLPETIDSYEALDRRLKSRRSDGQ